MFQRIIIGAIFALFFLLLGFICGYEGNKIEKEITARQHRVTWQHGYNAGWSDAVKEMDKKKNKSM